MWRRGEGEGEEERGREESRGKSKTMEKREEDSGAPVVRTPGC